MANFHHRDQVQVTDHDSPFYGYRGWVDGDPEVSKGRNYYSVRLLIGAHLDKPQSGIQSINMWISVTLNEKQIKKVR